MTPLPLIRVLADHPEHDDVLHDLVEIALHNRCDLFDELLTSD